MQDFSNRFRDLNNIFSVRHDVHRSDRLGLREGPDVEFCSYCLEIQYESQSEAKERKTYRAHYGLPGQRQLLIELDQEVPMKELLVGE